METLAILSGGIIVALTGIWFRNFWQTHQQLHHTLEKTQQELLTTAEQCRLEQEKCQQLDHLIQQEHLHSRRSRWDTSSPAMKSMAIALGAS